MSSLATNWALHLVVGGAQAALVGLLALVLVRLAPRSSAPWRHALLAVALLKFALPPMIPLPFGLFTAMTPALHPSFGQVESSLRGGELTIALMLVHVVGMIVASSRLVRASRSWQRWIESSTRDVSLTSAARSLALESRWRGLLPEVRTIPGLPVPMAGGIRHPVILVPPKLTDEVGSARVGLVLRHELEHLARRDPLWNLAGSLLQIIWWWHPILPVLLREMRRVREERCDDAVVSSFPGSACEYAHLLIDLVPRASTVAIPLPACAATGSLFEQRLRRLLDDGATRRSVVNRRSRAMLLLLALVMLPGFGFARFGVVRLPLASDGPASRRIEIRGHLHLHGHATGEHAAAVPRR